MNQDEVPEKHRTELLPWLQQLEGSSRLLLTSRPNIDLHDKFKSLSRISIRAAESDIEIYIRHVLKTSHRLSNHLAKDPALEVDLVTSVSQKAAGM